MVQSSLALLARSVACVCLALLATSVCAQTESPQTWHFDGLLFDDDHTATGSFVYDAALDEFSDIQLDTFAADGTLVNTYRDLLPGVQSGAFTLLVIPDATLEDLTGSPLLIVRLLTALSATGGTRTLRTADAAATAEAVCVQVECLNAVFDRRAMRGRVVSADDYVERVRWYLDGVVFDDATPASGQFDFLPATDTVIEPLITTRAGSGAVGATYSAVWPGSSASKRELRVVPDATVPDFTNEPLLLVDWRTDTHAGGGTAAVDLTGQSQEATLCSADGSCFMPDRLITAGRAVAPLLDVRVCSNPALDIPDDEALGVSDDLTIPFAGAITDLNVELQVAHPFVGDLALGLEHIDSGVLVSLVDRPGVPALDATGCPGADVLALLTDEGGASFEDTCNGQAPSISGALTPVAPLSTFDGQTLAGTWRLAVSDNAPDNVGTLVEWCLQAKVVSGPEGTDYDNDGVVDAADNCLLNAASQTDGDADGFGNACDADLNNDCTVNVVDLGLLRSVFFTSPQSPEWNPAADLNDDGIVNVIDLGLMRTRFFAAPGPSGVSNGCE